MLISSPNVFNSLLFIVKINRACGHLDFSSWDLLLENPMATKDDFIKVIVDWGECKGRYKTIIFYKLFFDDLIKDVSWCTAYPWGSLSIPFLGNLPWGYDCWWLEPFWEWGYRGWRGWLWKGCRVITNRRVWSRRNEGEGALGYSLVVACVTD